MNFIKDRLQLKLRTYKSSVLTLLLWSQLVGVTTLSLSAVGGSWRQSSVTFSANRFFTVVFLSQNFQRWINSRSTTSQSQDQMQSRFFLDIVVRKGSAIFQLFTSKDQSLLVRWNTFFVLNLGFDIVNGVGRFDFQGNGFTSQSFNETRDKVSISVTRDGKNK